MLPRSRQLLFVFIHHGFETPRKLKRRDKFSEFQIKIRDK